MILTDTHTHLYSEQFNDDIDTVVESCIEKGISRLFLPNIDSSSIDGMMNLGLKFPDNCFPMMGLHPTSVGENYKEELALVEEWLSKKDFCAVGEIGIDLYWDKTHLKEQQEAFRFQIELAKKYDLPFVIHCRDAFDEIFEILEAEKSDDLRGIFHCFTGTLEQAKLAISYNMKLGIGGVATFKNGKIDKFLNEIDLKHIVLETDSPYLAPTPYRGKRNESAFITNIVDKLVDIYNLSFKEIAEITTQNSKDVFGV